MRNKREKQRINHRKGGENEEKGAKEVGKRRYCYGAHVDHVLGASEEELSGSIMSWTHCTRKWRRRVKNGRWYDTSRRRATKEQ